MHKCSVLEQSAWSTNTVSGQPFLCSVCHRTFHGSGDLKRLKCSVREPNQSVSSVELFNANVVSVG